jgi:hypothetical protein
VDVDHALREAGEERGGDELHVAGEHDQLDAGRRQPVGHREVARGPVGVFGRREDARGHAGRAGPLERAGLRFVGPDGDDLDAFAPVHTIEDRLQVRPFPRGEDADLHAHSEAGSPRVTPPPAPGSGRRST